MAIRESPFARLLPFLSCIKRRRELSFELARAEVLVPPATGLLEAPEVISTGQTASPGVAWEGQVAPGGLQKSLGSAGQTMGINAAAAPPGNLAAMQKRQLVNWQQGPVPMKDLGQGAPEVRAEWLALGSACFCPTRKLSVS